MKNYSEVELKTAHKYSFANRNSIESSHQCGCYDCLSIFSSKMIKDWHIERDGRGQTAWCPVCGFDTVIADFDHEINEDFLSAMNWRWCDGGSPLSGIEFASFTELFDAYRKSC